MKKKNFGFGWIPQPIDNRDIPLSIVQEMPVTLPIKIDLRKNCPGVYHQGRLGSCTANAIAGAYEYDMVIRNKEIFTPSRLFIYFNEREMEGSVNEDAGAYIRDGMKSVNRHGVCPEPEWPYLVDKFRQKPPKECYAHATEHQVIEYFSVKRDVMEIKSCLALGFPVIFGFIVYSSFMSSSVQQTGHMSMPTPEDKQEGGHAVCFVGYNDETKEFIVRNSWGTNWGDKGYFYMPYSYLLFCNDFWTIRVIE